MTIIFSNFDGIQILAGKLGELCTLSLRIRKRLFPKLRTVGTWGKTRNVIDNIEGNQKYRYGRLDVDGGRRKSFRLSEHCTRYTVRPVCFRLRNTTNFAFAIILTVICLERNRLFGASGEHSLTDSDVKSFRKALNVIHTKH